MAKQTINIGTTANDGTGDPLRTAFDKVNDNFTELYSDDAGDVGSIIAGTGISVDQATGDVTVTNSSPDQTVALTDGTGITTSGTYPNFTITNSEPNATHTGDVTGSAALTIADNVVSYEKIDDEFTTLDTLTAAATVNVDFDAAQLFTLTPTSSTTLNITNPKIGITKTLIVTGAGSSYTLSFNVGGASGTFNLIAGEYDDTSSTKNLIQILCVSATEFWYSISQIAS